MPSHRFRILLLIYVCLLVALAAFTAGDYGISWDEPFRWKSGDQKLAYYERLFSADDRLDAVGTGGKDVYPGLYDLPLSWARKYTGVDKFILSRAWTALFAVALALAPVALTRLLLLYGRREALPRDAGWEDFLPFFAGAALLLMPELNGHLFMNPKDVPFAATYGWGVVALVWVVGSLDRMTFKRAAALGLAIGLAMATRPPGVALIGYYAALASLWAMLMVKEEGLRGKVKLGARLGAKGLASLCIAGVILTIFWPRAHGSLASPFTSAIVGVDQLHSYSASKPVLYGGQFYEAGSTPWSYSLWMFAIKQPEWLLALFLGTLGAAVPRLAQWRGQFMRGERQSWAVATVVLALAFPWGYVLLTQPAIHNGFRHMFYVLPLVAVFAAFGWKWLWTWVRPVPRWRYASIAFFGAGVALTLFSIVRLYPYQYVYYNAFVGGIGGAYGQYETEYWFTAGMEGATELNAYLAAHPSGGGPATVCVVGPSDVVEPFLSSEVTLTDDLKDADFYLGRLMNSETLAGGKIVHLVSRSGVPLLAVIDLRR